MEEGRKRKEGVKLDWKELLEDDDGEPPSLVVVKTGASKYKRLSEPEGTDDGGDEQAYGQDFQHMSDRQLEDLLARRRNNFETLSSKLPDKGKKLKASLERLENESQRRERLRAQQDDDDNMMPTQSRNSNSVGPSDFEPADLSEECTLQPSFASLFGRKLEEDKDCRTDNAFSKELSNFRHCDHRKERDKKHFALIRRQKNGFSLKRTPFECPTNVSINDKRQFILNGHQEGQSPSYSPCENDSYGFSLKRRNTSKLRTSIISKPINTVVLLDEEESHLKETELQAEQTNDCAKESKIYYPSRNDPESVEIYYADIECLAPEAYLSSSIMNFYIRYLQQQKLPAHSTTCDYHVFNTYFYSKLKDALSCKETLFVKFRRWWKGLNVFRKAYVLLPVHDNLHWSLVIICNPDKEDESGPIILHLDSLGLHFSRSIFFNIKSFLEEEWKCLNQGEAPSDLPIADEIWRNLPHKILKRKITVPQQNNDHDCGVFVLFFMERFIQQAPQRLKKEDLTMFGKQWFRPEEASGLRCKIKNLLTEEFNNANKENSDSYCLSS